MGTMILAAATHQVSASSSLGSFRLGSSRRAHQRLSSFSSVRKIASRNPSRDSPMYVARLEASSRSTTTHKIGKKVTTGSKATEQKTTPPTTPSPQHQAGRSKEDSGGVSSTAGVSSVTSAKGGSKAATTPKVSEGGGGKHKKEKQRVAEAASQLTPAEVRAHVVDDSKAKEAEPSIASNADNDEDKQGHHHPVYSGPKFVALSIKYAATGRGHNDRYPCWVAAVDEHGNVLVDLKVRVPGLLSPLTSLTGLVKHQIEAGQPLERAVAELKKHIRHGGSVVTLIGETPADDSAWLGIERGQDFATVVDLPQTFAVRKTKGANAPIRMPLWALASGLSDNLLVSAAAPRGADAVADAKTAMALFTEVLRDVQKAEKAKRTLRHLLNAESPLLFGHNVPRAATEAPRPLDRVAYAEGIDGVCCSKYDPAGCFCGQPVAKHWLHHES